MYCPPLVSQATPYAAWFTYHSVMASVVLERSTRHHHARLHLVHLDIKKIPLRHQIPQGVYSTVYGLEILGFGIKAKLSTHPLSFTLYFLIKYIILIFGVLLRRDK